MLDMVINFDDVQAEIIGSSRDVQVSIQRGLVEAARFVRDVWVSAVSGNSLPGMSRAIQDDQYARSLKTGESLRFPTPFEAIVMPVGFALEAQSIEDGTGPFDMKTDRRYVADSSSSGWRGGLLDGPKSRPLKDGGGRFNTIPFRHYAPASKAAGNSALAIRMQMPSEIYQQARKLSRSVQTAVGERIVWGQSLTTDLPAETSFNGYQHDTSTYDGMYRVGDARNSRYLTFRRVSTYREVTGKNGKTKTLGSSPLSWWHPGAPPNHIVQAVYDHCMPIIETNLMKIATSAI